MKLSRGGRRALFLAASFLCLCAVIGAVWARRCFRDIEVTAGAHLGIPIGATKPEAFRQVLALYRSGTIVGFRGLDRTGKGLPLEHRWEANAADLDRLALYDRWTLIGPDSKTVAVLSLRDGALQTITVHDSTGAVIASPRQWAPGMGVPTLRIGLDPQAAVDDLREYFVKGVVLAAETTVHDVATPVEFDESAYAALEPWDTWRLSPHDWGGIWLTFEDDRLVRIYQRIRCLELR